MSPLDNACIESRSADANTASALAVDDLGSMVKGDLIKGVGIGPCRLS
jgi:hypothetical protein